MTAKGQYWDAKRALQAGDRAGARRMLEELVRAEPDCADAWLLLFAVLDDPHEKLDALKQAQRIRPRDETIREKLRHYKASAEYRAVKTGQREARKEAEARSQTERKRVENRRSISAFFSSLFSRLFSPADDPDRGIFNLRRRR